MSPLLSPLVSRLLAAVRAALRERETRKALADLSDWTLRDIGLRRDQIESVARRRAG